MKNYNLGFVADEIIFEHVKQTVLKYRHCIDLKQFNENIIDPIKLTFDAKVYGKSFEEIIEAECVRQIDKTNSNHIGYFHQNLFKLVGRGWEVPDTGFDIINVDRHLYAELKNKHN
ncbi:MAG: Eco47II family restriction endonuclease, partial [Alistipes sp.]